MSTFNKFQPFTEALAEKVHNLGSDTLTLFLTNSAPTADMANLSEITQIAYTNLSSRVLTQASSAQTGGQYKLVINDITLTASGGSVGPFRYIGVFNDTAPGDPLICWFDYGSSITLADGESLEVDFDGSNGLLTIGA